MRTHDHSFSFFPQQCFSLMFVESCLHMFTCASCFTWRCHSFTCSLVQNCLHCVAILSQVCGEYKTLPPTRFFPRVSLYPICFVSDTCLVHFSAPRMVASSMHLKVGVRTTQLCTTILFGRRMTQKRRRRPLPSK